MKRNTSHQHKRFRGERKAPHTQFAGYYQKLFKFCFNTVKPQVHTGVVRQRVTTLMQHAIFQCLSFLWRPFVTHHAVVSPHMPS